MAGNNKNKTEAAASSELTRRNNTHATHTSSSVRLIASMLQVHPHGSDCPTTHSVSQTLLEGRKEFPGQYLLVRYSRTKLSRPGLYSGCSSWKTCMSTLQSKAPPSSP